MSISTDQKVTANHSQRKAHLYVWPSTAFMRWPQSSNSAMRFF